MGLPGVSATSAGSWLVVVLSFSLIREAGRVKKSRWPLQEVSLRIHMYIYSLRYSLVS